MTMRRTMGSIAAIVLVGALQAAQMGVAAQGAGAGAPSLLPPGEAGTPLHVEGRIIGPGGPVAGAALYVYQTDQRGYYSGEVNDDNTKPRLKARFATGPDGSFAFRTIMPGQYPRNRPAGPHPPRGDADREADGAVRAGLRGRLADDRRHPCRRKGREVLRDLHAGGRRRRREAVHRRHFPRPLTPPTTPESRGDDSGVLCARLRSRRENPLETLDVCWGFPRRLRSRSGRTPESSWRDSGVVRWSSGERDPEGGGVAGGALEGVVEAVAGEDLADQRQADPLAVRLGAEERREQVGLRLRCQAGPLSSTTSVGGPSSTSRGS